MTGTGTTSVASAIAAAAAGGAGAADSGALAADDDFDGETRKHAKQDVFDRESQNQRGKSSNDNRKEGTMSISGSGCGSVGFPLLPARKIT